MSTTEVGAKGRLVIPAQVRAEAGVEPGQAVVVWADGVGRIVIETLDAVQARVWAGAPASEQGADAVRDVRRTRADDAQTSDEAASQRARGAASERDQPDEAGIALLAALGR